MKGKELTQQLLDGTIGPLFEKYDAKVVLKSKRVFSILSIDDVPYSLKLELKPKLQELTELIGRKNYIIDNPNMIGETIKGGIWLIRIL